MKHLGVVLALLACFGAHAQSQSVTVAVNGAHAMQVFGATAAFAVDPDVADASVHAGVVSFFGRGVGKTQITVISGSGQTTFDVTVEPRRGTSRATMKKSSGTEARIETRAATAPRQIANRIDVVRESGSRRTEVHVETVNYREDAGTRAATTLPSASYRIFTGSRELTLLDRNVDHSTLTVHSTSVRGLHFIGERWRVHAGRTAYASYQSFLLPAQSETVLGVAYVVPVGARTRLTPGVFAFPDAEGDRRGGVASLVLDHERGDTFVARAELAVSRGVGAALELAYARERQRMRVDLRYRPRHFATATPGEPRGFFADASWSKEFAGRSSVDASVSATQFDLPGLDSRSITAMTNGHLRLTDHVSLLGGATYGAFDDTRSLTIPAGVQLDYTRFGISALARWSESSATNRGAPGFRIAARASTGHLFATASVDYQEQAPTLALIFREQPDLALALAQLGITATTPADIARALRENSALVELGYIDGVTIELAPSRLNGTFELAWLGSGAARLQLRARLLFSRTEGVTTRSETVIATLIASRRLTDRTDVFGSYSRWTTRRQGEEAFVQPVVELGVRHRFDELPSLGGGRGTISGTVFLDEDVDGKPDGVIGDAELELDGATLTRVSSDGSFVFRNVERGTHRVVARVAGDAYFTTPSRVEAKPGDSIRFGVAITPARIFGRVVSDAGTGVANVGVILTRGSRHFDAVSASNGSFELAAAPGEGQVAIDPSSLPPGYSINGPLAREVRLDRAAPLSIELSVRANRSIAGKAPAGVTSIVVEPDGRRIPVDEGGRFSVRSLPAGKVTLRAGSVVRQFTLSDQPVLFTDIAFAETAAVASARVERPFSVQLGVFRIESNALELVERAQRSGVETTLATNGGLTIVRSGGFVAREDAVALTRRLARAGIDGVVVRVQ